MTHVLPPVFSLPGWCTVWSCSTVFTCIQLRYSSAWRPMIVLGTLPFLALRVPCKYHLITLQNSPGKKSYTSSQKQLLKTRNYILQWDSVLYVNAHKILPPPPFLFWRSNQWASNFKKSSKQARKQACQGLYGRLSNVFVLQINIKPSNNSSLVWFSVKQTWSSKSLTLLKPPFLFTQWYLCLISPVKILIALHKESSDKRLLHFRVTNLC